MGENTHTLHPDEDTAREARHLWRERLPVTYIAHRLGITEEQVLAICLGPSA
jgi:hypothetical protein